MLNDNTALIESLNYYLALATLVGFIFLIIWVLDLIALKLGFLKGKRWAYEVFAKYTLPVGFFVTLAAMVGSLYYSYYLHIPACDLCWMARIFIYPLVFIFGYAWLAKENVKETKIFNHVMILSGVGLFISLYHHYLQLGYNLYKPCSTAPFAVECSTPTFIEFGFVTYPFMGVVVCGGAFLLAFTAKRFQK